MGIIEKVTEDVGSSAIFFATSKNPPESLISFGISAAESPSYKNDESDFENVYTVDTVPRPEIIPVVFNSLFNLSSTWIKTE